MPNGIDLLMADHRNVESLFAMFAETGDASVIGLVVDALSAHDDAEHGALYPLLAAVVDDAAMIERAAQAHSMVKQQIDLVTSLEGPPLVEAFRGLQTLVARHVADEESAMLPALAERATAPQLEGLGARILQIKQRVG